MFFPLYHTVHLEGQVFIFPSPLYIYQIIFEKHKLILEQVW